MGRVEALGADEEDLHTTQLTVGFADIVSFTALTNQLDHDRIGDLVEIFESRCADVVAGQRGRVIKSIGDAVLFVNEDPIRAYDTAEGIIAVIGRDPRMPDVRVGLSTGSVVMRLGDVFGPPVNMAARLTARRPAQPDHRRPRHRRPAARGPVRDPRRSRPGRCGASGWWSRWPYGVTERMARLAYDGRVPGEFTFAEPRVEPFPGARGCRLPIFDRVLEVQDVASTRRPAGCGATTARSCSRARSSTCCIA